MAREHFVLICTYLTIAQLFAVSGENIDWTTIHDELRKLSGTLRKRCVAETSVQIDLLEGAEVGEFPKDPKLACYFKCVMEKGGVMKKDGKINYKLLGKMMPQAFKAIGLDMLDECRDIRAKDKCELAFNFNECLFRSNPVAYFVV